MTIHPANEADSLASGDLLYAYVQTNAFFLPRKVPSGLPGFDDVIIECEDIHAVVVARLGEGSFSAYWAVGTQPAEQVSIPLHNEDVARRYFPILKDYAFKEVA